MYQRILYFLVLFSYVIGMIPAYISTFVSSKETCRKIIKRSFSMLDWIFVRSEYTELSLLPKKNYIYAINHQCYIDGWLMSSLQHDILVIAIDYLKHIPIIGRIFIYIDTVFKTLKKEFVAEGLTDKVIRKLKEHDSLSLYIYTEGERQLDNKFNKKLRTGTFHIAKSLNYDIVPIYQNYGNILNDKKQEYYPSYRKKIKTIVGTPISPEGKSAEKLKDEYIEQMLMLEKTYFS